MQTEEADLGATRQDGKNIIALQQQKNLDKHFTNLEDQINQLADDRRLDSMNLFLSDWHYHNKDRDRRLNRNPLVDNREPPLIRGLDVNMAIRKYQQELKEQNLKDFIERRLLGSIDLLKLQQDNSSMLHDRQ